MRGVGQERAPLRRKLGLRVERPRRQVTASGLAADSVGVVVRVTSDEFEWDTHFLGQPPDHWGSVVNETRQDGFVVSAAAQRPDMAECLFF